MFPDDTPMPLPFTLAGFNFAFFSGGVQAFVNESGAGRGLQFPDEGLKVKLPLPVTRLSLTVGQFSTPISIRLSNQNGGTVATATTAVKTPTQRFLFNCDEGLLWSPSLAATTKGCFLKSASPSEGVDF
jgi:hypothetical protein